MSELDENNYTQRVSNEHYQIIEINKLSTRVKKCNILCSIVDISDGKILVSDGTGNIWVNVPEKLMNKVELNTINRILGTVQKVGSDKLEVFAEIIHSLENIDIEILRKVRKLQESINWTKKQSENKEK